MATSSGAGGDATLMCRFLMAKSLRRSFRLAGQRRQQALVGAADGVPAIPSRFEFGLKAELPAPRARFGHLGPHPGPAWSARVGMWVSRRRRPPARFASAPPGRSCRRSPPRTLRHCLAGHRPAPHVARRGRLPLVQGRLTRGGTARRKSAVPPGREGEVPAGTTGTGETGETSAAAAPTADRAAQMVPPILSAPSMAAADAPTPERSESSAGPFIHPPRAAAANEELRHAPRIEKAFPRAASA